MELEDIGFYTLSEDRARNISGTSCMQRCEMIITDRCNFRCPYCRGVRGDIAGTMRVDDAISTITHWTNDGLRNIRFSGGEPTLHPDLPTMVRFARDRGVERIAISTNGSADPDTYLRLVEAGVNDFSISLDACCASGADKMAGVTGQFSRITTNIQRLSKETYVTVGIVLTEENVADVERTIQFAYDLGVADIRIISAAQYNRVLEGVETIDQGILDAHPILRYRVGNIKNHRNVRGIRPDDCGKCHLVKDDSVVAGKYHFPCVIYMREQGDPIGEVGPGMREDRLAWFNGHDSHMDPICSKNCLDVCIDFNNRCEHYASIK